MAKSNIGLYFLLEIIHRHKNSIIIIIMIKRQLNVDYLSRGIICVHVM